MACMATDTLIEPAGDVYMWVEQGSSVMLKAVTSFGDPVELTADEVQEVIAALQLSLKRLQADDKD
jgi:hypothetical protein